jgi:hypothetical protein
MGAVAPRQYCHGGEVEVGTKQRDQAQRALVGLGKTGGDKERAQLDRRYSIDTEGMLNSSTCDM